MKSSPFLPLLLTVVVAAIAPIPAQAQITIGQTVTLNFQSVSPGVTVQMQADGTNYGPGPAAGMYRFATSNNINFDPIFETFCIEISQFVSTSASTYEVVDLASGSANSNPDNIPDVPAGGIGATRALNLQILYYNAFGPTWESTDFGTFFVSDGSLTANERKAGFQFAIWELAHDDATTINAVSNAFSFTTGGFKITVPGSADASRLFGQSLLDGVTTVLNSGTTPDFSGIQLAALHSATRQDQLVVIPEPGTWAAFLGFACVVFAVFRRRLTRRT